MFRGFPCGSTWVSVMGGSIVFIVGVVYSRYRGGFFHRRTEVKDADKSETL